MIAGELHPVIRRLVTAQRIEPGTPIDLTPLPSVPAHPVLARSQPAAPARSPFRPAPRPLLSLAVQPPPPRDVTPQRHRAGKVAGSAAGSRLHTCGCGRVLKGSGARNSHMRGCPASGYTPAPRPEPKVYRCACGNPIDATGGRRPPECASCTPDHVLKRRGWRQAWRARKRGRVA